MGHYTYLHCKAIINPEHRENIKQIVFKDAPWSNFYTHQFVKLERSMLIPFGENKLKKEEIFDGSTLVVQCSIKNYEDELDCFFEFLKEISSEILEYKTLNEDNYDDDRSTGIRTYHWYNYLTEG